jgi:hypothetical protein
MSPCAILRQINNEVAWPPCCSDNFSVSKANLFKHPEICGYRSRHWYTACLTQIG